METDEGLTQALRAFERSATAATATVFSEFTRLRTDFKLKPLELFNLLGPPTRRTVALAQAAFQPLRTSVVQLEDSPWHLSTDDYLTFFGPGALFSRNFVETLAKYAYSGVSWPRAQVALRQARDARCDNNSRRQRISSTRDWVPQDIKDAMALHAAVPARRQAKRVASHASAVSLHPSKRQKRISPASDSDGDAVEVARTAHANNLSDVLDDDDAPTFQLADAASDASDIESLQGATPREQSPASIAEQDVTGLGGEQSMPSPFSNSEQTFSAHAGSSPTSLQKTAEPAHESSSEEHPPPAPPAPPKSVPALPTPLSANPTSHAKPQLITDPENEAIPSPASLFRPSKPPGQNDKGENKARPAPLVRSSQVVILNDEHHHERHAVPASMALPTPPGGASPSLLFFDAEHAVSINEQLQDAKWVGQCTLWFVLRLFDQDGVCFLDVPYDQLGQNKCSGRPLQNKAHVLLPFYLPTWRHWVLLHLDITKKQATVYDSMLSLGASCGMQDAARAAVDHLSLEWDARRWTYHVANNVVQQDGGDDCGIFTIVFGLHLALEMQIPQRITAPLWRYIFRGSCGGDSRTTPQVQSPEATPGPVQRPPLVSQTLDLSNKVHALTSTAEEATHMVTVLSKQICLAQSNLESTGQRIDKCRRLIEHDRAIGALIREAKDDGGSGDYTLTDDAMQATSKKHEQKLRISECLLTKRTYQKSAILDMMAAATTLYSENQSRLKESKSAFERAEENLKQYKEYFKAS